MRVVVCDKCGKEMNVFEWSPTKFPYIKVERFQNRLLKTTYDLCYDCQTELEQWLQKEEQVYEE